MLRTLAIRNLAIIDELDIGFGPGLNVLSGETGAGKSIIIGALELVLGGRAGPDLVRAGSSRASVDAVFDLGGAESVRLVLEQMGYDAPDGDLLLSRELQDNGKSVARICGRPATVTALREIGEWLVDLHGQHEHQSLLVVRRHGEMLDDYAGEEVRRLVATVAQEWRRVRDLEAELNSLESDARARLRQIDLYRFQVEEIRAAGLRPQEETELAEEVARLRNVERLREGVGAALQWLDGSAASALDALAYAKRELESAASLDVSLFSASEAVASARFEIEEVARALSRYLDGLEADPARLNAAEERLARLSDLKRKYGSTVEEVLAYGEHAASELERLENAEQNADELRNELQRVQDAYAQHAAELSRRRQETALRFQASVAEHLAELALDRSRFEVSISAGEPGPRGTDVVEFLFAANAGEPLRPLARIASGGEISRVMLAIKSAASSRSPLPTMVFDEIDAGIGGRTADAIARKMRMLADSAQILCITHLAPIAAAADHHCALAKVELRGRTVVRVTELDGDARVEELARMLAGSKVTDAVRQHVRDLLRQAHDDTARH